MCLTCAHFVFIVLQFRTRRWSVSLVRVYSRSIMLLLCHVPGGGVRLRGSAHTDFDFDFINLMMLCCYLSPGPMCWLGELINTRGSFEFNK